MATFVLNLSFLTKARTAGAKCSIVADSVAVVSFDRFASGIGISLRCGRAKIGPATGVRGERICWVILNPSDADHEYDDPIILRCIHFTKSWGYAGFTVVNLYPYRSPHPIKCEAWAKDKNLAAAVRAALQQNALIVSVQTRDAKMVVAAWGNNPWDEAMLATAVESILTNRQEIYRLGTTMEGAPKHPMARGKHRIPNEQQPVLWRSGQ